MSLQKDSPGLLEKGAEPTGAQILAAIESSRQAMKTQIVAIAVDVNLLRADLRVVAERSVATEKQVTCLQSEMDTLKASVATLEAKTHKLEARVEDATVGMVQLQRQSFAGVKRKLKELGYTCMLLFPANLKVLHAGRSHFFQSPEAAWDWLERNDVVGTPDFLVGESDRRTRGTAEVHTAPRRSTRRCRAGQGGRVIVRSDGTLSLEH
ncbi:hypothetical protein NDU88_004054 [Pleurodeles waltl]|uniref:Uncharacterized protein n=1 Tax=Pleurodeles waltl TaxID=8319 RepID=A0AAV7SHN0_PLEWA|nr:hypothetical protein NDU88_004054 [Pleurodeles waltl]